MRALSALCGLGFLEAIVACSTDEFCAAGSSML
jgi:hypothetical protein